MEIFRDESEFPDVRMVQRVVDMFEHRPGFQRIVRLGLIGMEINDDLDGTDEDEDGTVKWASGHSHFHGYPRLSEIGRDRGLIRNHTLSSGSVYQLPQHYFSSSCEVPRPVKVQSKESDSERRARILEEVKKEKEKAEKKRLKKMKRKERKRLEKLEKEKRNPIKKEAENDDSQQSKTKGSKPDNESPQNTISSDKQCAATKDTDSSDSSENESSDEDSDARNDSGDSEELDMTSTFVSKAALIARRKLDQKPTFERKEKKKTPVKEEPKTVPGRPTEDLDVEKKDSVTISTPTFEDNVKISTDLAIIGNKFASAGDFNMAVKYFTDAIKHNPTEFKLFGNRSFCFEKMQEYEKALTDAELCLSMWPGWVKGLFRKGRALAGLKRYEEAAQAFREVLKLDSSCAEAAQELMWVQITQLMGYGFTREQSSNALIIHGTVKKALEVLSKLNHRPGAIYSKGTIQPAQVANVSGLSPGLSANAIPARAPHSHDAPKPAFRNQPLGPVQNMTNVQSQPASIPSRAMKTNNEAFRPPPEVFPVWVGNLVHPVTESVLTNVFRKVGAVDSVKVLTYKRCAFVNFTKQEYCDEAIRRLHGSDLNGMKIAVRYPDRIPHGLGISRSALKADDLQDDIISYRQKEYSEGRNAVGSRRTFRPYRQIPEY